MQSINFTVDQNACILCGLCVEDCPGSCLVMAGHPVMGKEDSCIRCQHCLAICPTGSVSIMGCEPKNSVTLDGKLPTPDELTTLVRGRRSCRNYQDRNVDPKLIEDLLTSAWHAPTGCNAQQVMLTVVSDKEKLRDFRAWLIDELAKVMDEPRFADTHGLGFVRRVVREWTESKKDILFRGAPHLVVASTSEQAVCTKEDSVIALSYFELLANCANLGTVWDGIAYYSISTFVPEAKKRLGIPDNHTVGYCMAFGHPAMRYQRTVQRTPANINFVR